MESLGSLQKSSPQRCGSRGGVRFMRGDGSQENKENAVAIAAVPRVNAPLRPDQPVS